MKDLSLISELKTNLETKVYENFIDLYRDLSNELDKFSNIVVVRGLKTKERLAQSFIVLDQTKRFRLENEKRELYLFGELLWYLAGSYSVDEIGRFSKFWYKVADEFRRVNSNYGHRIFRDEKTFFRALSMLEKDIYSRQAIVHINLPRDIRRNNRDIPCTLMLHFFVRRYKDKDYLNMFVYMRSNDLIKGTTYDLFAFSLFQQIMYLFLKQKYLDLELGYFHQMSQSLHIYEQDFENVKKYQSKDFYKAEDFKLKKLLIDRNGLPIQEVREIFKRALEEPERALELKKFFS